MRGLLGYVPIVKTNLLEVRRSAILLGTLLINGLASLAGGAMITGAGVVVGAPTGGDKGVGTVNATGYFVNGTTVPFTLAYQSADTAITTSASNPFVHGLGATPKMVQILMVCATAEFNYSIADVVVFAAGIRPGANIGTGVVITATNVNVLVQSTPFPYVNKTTFADCFLTPANWRFRVVAYA